MNTIFPPPNGQAEMEAGAVRKTSKGARHIIQSLGLGKCCPHYESGWVLGVVVDDIFSVRCCCCLKGKNGHSQAILVTLVVIWIYSDESQMQMVTQFSVYCQMTIKNSLAGTLATTNIIQSFGE